MRFVEWKFYNNILKCGRKTDGRITRCVRVRGKETRREKHKIGKYYETVVSKRSLSLPQSGWDKLFPANLISKTLRGYSVRRMPLFALNIDIILYVRGQMSILLSIYFTHGFFHQLLNVYIYLYFQMRQWRELDQCWPDGTTTLNSREIKTKYIRLGTIFICCGSNSKNWD